MAQTPPARWDADAGEWEICNDAGFVYKCRRRLRIPTAAARRSDDDDLAARRRARRKQCLLNLKEKYRRELQQWEALEASLLHLADPPAPAAPPPPPPPSTASSGARRQLIEDLVLQVEAQEAVLQKMSALCDYVEAECDARREALVGSMIELPIWGSPRTLMASLADDCSSS